MSHPAVDELWLDLVEGTLPEAEALPLREHLESCAACADRYARLVRAHQLSSRAGAALRVREPAAVPEEIERRVLAAARQAAGGAPRRRLWMLPAWTAVAAAAAVLLVLRIGGHRDDERLLRGTLALLESPAGMRGPEDALGSRAADIEKRWRAGDLRLRTARTACPDGELRITALQDARGAPALLAVGQGDRADVYVYGADGAEVGSARVAGGARLEFALPPLAQEKAQALIAAPSCSPARR